MSIISNFLLIPASTNGFSSLNSISGRTQANFLTSHFHLATSTIRFDTMKIWMGGGPRTYPGGVTKWQWKRMQANKSKQLLKARLARERQIYEMRKRAELKEAVTELERPWEVVEKAPNLFSVGADEQLKVLADRFQRPGGFDMWSERDGPELFKTIDDDVPSARFFPKGVVHSIKPYGKIEISDNSSEKPRPQNHSEINFNTDFQHHVVDENRGEHGDSVNQKYLGDVSVNRPGEIRQKKIADNVNNSGVKPNRSRQKNYRDKFSVNSGDNGNDLGTRRTTTREVNYNNKFSRNSVEGEESKEQKHHQIRYDDPGNTQNVNDLRVMRNRSSNNNRYSGNKTENGYRMGNARRNHSPRKVNRIGMTKDLDVYDMSVQQDGSYEFQD